MDIFSVISMAGGLALFLFGMDFMGSNLSRASGGKMEQILEKLTGNPLKAVALGTGVTAVIQSSSATTVMVVGFVNSGIMRLSQATGIIMGANIGTTITSWMLSLAGIEGDVLWLRLLKPSALAPLMAFAGIVLYMFVRNEHKKYIGGVFLGFAVLMGGMEAMGSAVKPLADVPEFTGILTLFSHPMAGLAAGAILTAVIQSSSASVGILQALCATGAVSYGTALPIIMGQNIGTCVTAMVSAVGASKNARRAAFIHLYFNMIGTAVFMIVFYAANALRPFAFLGAAAPAPGIAFIHSCFNIGATCLLLPFAGMLERLACYTVRDGKKTTHMENRLGLLDSRFLDQPALAMEHCSQVMHEMSELTANELDIAVGLLNEYNEENAGLVLEMERLVDTYEDRLGSYLMEVSLRDLNTSDSYDLSILLHCISDMERISDHAAGVQRCAKEMRDKGLAFSARGRQEIDLLSGAVRELVHNTASLMEFRRPGDARKIEPLKEVVDDLSDRTKLNHVERLRKGSCTIEMGVVLNELVISLERAADHCSNVAVSILEQENVLTGRHALLREMKHGNNGEFRQMYEFYRDKYGLEE